MRRSGFNPNQQHQAFTSLQTYNPSDKPARNKHNHYNHDSSANNNNYQSNRNYNFKNKSNSNFTNQHKISIERPRAKQTATTAFSIGIGQAQISSSISTPLLNQPEISIEKSKSAKLEFRSNSSHNVILSTVKADSEELLSDTIGKTNNLISSKNDILSQQFQSNKAVNDNTDKANLNPAQVPIKDNYTPDEILSLKPTSLPNKRIQAPGFITLLRFFSENQQDNDNSNFYRNKNYKKNRNNRNWKNGKSNNKCMTLREHSENRFIGLSMVSRAGLSNEFSAEIKRAQAQVILNKLSKVNISSSLQEIQLLKIPTSVIIDLLLDTATSDSDFPERNPQIGNMLDFTFRFCANNNEFKTQLVLRSLAKSEDINNKINPLSSIGSLQSTITWLAALFAGFMITDYQFVNFSQQVIEKQPLERALEIIRTGLYVAGRSLDQRNKTLGEPLFEFLQNHPSRHGYTNFLISELFYLRNSGWDAAVVERFQPNGNQKKSIHIVKRSTSQSTIQSKQDSNPSVPMISSSSTSNLSKLANSNSNYNEINLIGSIEEIELLFLNNKCSDANANDLPLETKSNSKSILNFVSKNKLESIIHSCFYLFKKHIQNSTDFASFTEKLISASIDNKKTQTNTDNIMKDNEDDKSIGNEKVISLILNEQSLFESIVREEESKQLWFPVFMLNSYLYSNGIIPFDIIIKSYTEIPDDCFKPDKVQFINKVAEITGAPIEEVEKLKNTFCTKSENQSEEKNEQAPTQINNNDDKVIEALINLCNPIDKTCEPTSEIAAGVFIRDIFDDIFYNNEEEAIDFEKIKAEFEPYKEIINKIIQNYRKIATFIIDNTLQQCEMNDKQLQISKDYFNI